MLFSTFPIFLSLPLSHNSLLGEDFLAFIFFSCYLVIVGMLTCFCKSHPDVQVNAFKSKTLFGFQPI